MKFSSPDKVGSFIREIRAQSTQQREAIERKEVVAFCYQIGKHWINESDIGFNVNQDFSPKRRRRTRDRISRNKIDMMTYKTAAASFPNRIRPNVILGVRDFTSDGAFEAQVNEDMLGVIVEKSGLDGAARRAGLRRTLTGQHGLGIELKMSKRSRKVGDNEVSFSDTEIKAFDFGAYMLSLDPAIESLDLMDHETVTYSDVWTREKILRKTGIKLSENQLTPFGKLTPIQQAGYFHSDGMAYSGFRAHSKTPAARIHFVYTKGSRDRFDYLYAMIEVSGGKMIPILENDNNPFGGSGMPLVIMQGYIPGRGSVYLSDFDLLKSHQDALNLTYTQFMRILRKNAGVQYMVDRNAYPRNASDDDIRGQLTNEAFGINLYDGKKGSPPVPIQVPSPPPIFTESIRDHENTIQEAGFRPDATFGQVKSHVPDASFERALDAAGDVYGQRVISDLGQYKHLSSVILGTCIRLVQNESVGTIQLLHENGFGGAEFEAVLRQRHDCPTGEVVIRDSAARYQSQTTIKRNLDNALAAGAVSPTEYRVSVLNDLDTPLSSSDRSAKAFAQASVRSIMSGEPYEPKPVSIPSHSIIVSEFEKAMLDPKIDPESSSRLAQAIQAQNALLAPPEDAQAGAQAEQGPQATDSSSPLSFVTQPNGQQIPQLA